MKHAKNNFQIPSIFNFLAPVSPQKFQCLLVPSRKKDIKLYRGWVLRESGQSVGTPLLGSDLGSDRGILSDTDTRNDRPTVRPTDRPTDCPTDYRLFRQSAFLPFLSFTAVFGQKLLNRRGKWACLAWATINSSRR